MCEYAFMAASSADLALDRIFASTDSPIIKDVARNYGAEVIDRPEHLAMPDSLTEDVLIHAGEAIVKSIGKAPDLVALFFANNPAIDCALAKEGLDFLESSSDFDSAFSVCRYDMFSVARARKVNKEGVIQPWVPLELFEDRISSIRSDGGATYFCDLSVQILRWRCFTEMDEGMLPFKWMGKKSKALFNDYGFDVDSEWQLCVLEKWLRDRGMGCRGQ
jgi:CMP-N-acetylneuraminic acid synthetase